MISQRSQISLAQFLGLFGLDFVLPLLTKHFDEEDVEHVRRAREYREDPTERLTIAAETANNNQLISLLNEIARTRGDLRNRIQPRYRFDQRVAELERCLELDGYEMSDDGLLQLDPQVEGGEPVEDGLTAALGESNLPQSEEIVSSVKRSHEAYRTEPFDYNACLTHARVALQSIARSIAEQRREDHPADFDEESWGEVLDYLQRSNLISEREEQGLAGVFTFVSPGAHRLIGLSERQMARLGRSLVIGMCYFLVRRYMG